MVKGIRATVPSEAAWTFGLFRNWTIKKTVKMKMIFLGIRDPLLILTAWIFKNLIPN
jgi:hypothetical protein